MGGNNKAYANRVMPSETAAAIEMQIANQSVVKNLMLCVMRILFEPCQAGQLQLASRIVMAPLTRNRAPQVLANALMAEYYAQRANPATGAGLMITALTTRQTAPLLMAVWQQVKPTIQASKLVS